MDSGTFTYSLRDKFHSSCDSSSLTPPIAARTSIVRYSVSCSIMNILKNNIFAHDQCTRHLLIKILVIVQEPLHRRTLCDDPIGDVCAYVYASCVSFSFSCVSCHCEIHREVLDKLQLLVVLDANYLFQPLFHPQPSPSFQAHSSARHLRFLLPDQAGKF